MWVANIAVNSSRAKEILFSFEMIIT